MKKEEKKGMIVSKETVKKKRYSQGLPVFNAYAAGIDVGDTQLVAAKSQTEKIITILRYFE